MQCPKCSHESICGKKTDYAALYDTLTKAAEPNPAFTVTIKVDCAHYSRKHKGKVVE